jgi:hypothetical protein
VFLGEPNRFLPVDCFGANLVALFDFKHLAKRLADYRIAIGDQNALGRLSAPRMSRTW